jgi:hypothetical protein
MTQSGIRVVPLVIINGQSADPAITHELRADRRLRVFAIEPPSLPAALLAGRKLVDTPFFSELDDDDILLPGALAARLHVLEQDSACGAVISNGFRRNGDGDTLHITDVAFVERDPVRALLRNNWLLPGSWLCRSDTVGPNILAGMPKYFECTYLALQLATHCRIRILAEPTVVWHTDAPLQVTRSRDYILGQVPALRRILELELPDDVRAEFRSRMAQACHAAAELHLREGALADAWSWYFRSLKEPGGWRYLSFVHRLVRGARGARASTP